MGSYITVVGSINMDLVVKTHRIPQVGETVLGQDLREFPGGKGANQAVAASRLGAVVKMVGCVGRRYGEELIRNLSQNEVNTSGVFSFQERDSGAALIYLDERGENSIMVIPGANQAFGLDELRAQEEIITNSCAVLLQLEIPRLVVYKAVEMASQAGVKVLFNPAPMLDFNRELLGQVDYLILNAIEVDQLLGQVEVSPDAAIRQIQGFGVQQVIITRGAEGCYYNVGQNIFYQKAQQVDAVDTTGAGDTFVGALVASIYHNLSLKVGIQWASKAAALSVTRIGAQSSMPYLRELQKKGWWQK